MRSAVSLLLPILLAVMPAQTRQDSATSAIPRPETIFFHGNIYTGVAGPGSFHPTERAQALAVRDGRIVAVGKDSDVLRLKGPRTELIDLNGHFVMPGFNDAHLHLASAGFQSLDANLAGVKSLDEFRDRIRARLRTASPGAWILGRGWDETLWPVQVLPSRWDIDEITTDHPVFLQRVDGHMAVANSRALQLASITIASRDPQGGAIDHDSTGQPTGILRDTAWAAVASVVPVPTHEERLRAIQAALQKLAQWGVTSAQDNSEWEDFQALEELERDGKLTARVSEWLNFNDPLDTLQAHRDEHPQSDMMLHTGMLKGFMDGSLGSHTAALLEPYADDPSTSGLPRYEQAKLNAMTNERLNAGFQIGFHAIGDRGVQMALEAFSRAEKDAVDKKAKAPDGSSNFRLRIEHAQVTTPAQIGEFKNLHVIASMQPCHLLTDMNWAENVLGRKRAADSYAWLSFLENGVVLAFGTDFPVEPVSPFRGLYAAVTRKSENGKKEYFPERKLSIEQAISAYTVGSATAEFAEKDKGILIVGKFADFVVLDRDITAVNPPEILGAKVLRTVVGARTVYESK